MADTLGLKEERFNSAHSCRDFSAWLGLQGRTAMAVGCSRTKTLPSWWAREEGQGTNAALKQAFSTTHPDTPWCLFPSPPEGSQGQSSGQCTFTVTHVIRTNRPTLHETGKSWSKQIPGALTWLTWSDALLKPNSTESVPFTFQRTCRQGRSPGRSEQGRLEQSFPVCAHCLTTGISPGVRLEVGFALNTPPCFHAGIKALVLVS